MHEPKEDDESNIPLLGNQKLLWDKRRIRYVTPCGNAFVQYVPGYEFWTPSWNPERGMKCHECGSEDFVERNVEIGMLVGEYYVYDRSLSRRPVCTDCGEYTVTHAELVDIELRTAIAAFNKAPHVTGPMLKFARKALGMSRKELADCLSTKAGNVVQWESEERPEELVSLALLGLLYRRVMPTIADVEVVE